MSQTNKKDGCLAIPEGLIALIPCDECQGECQSDYQNEGQEECEGSELVHDLVELAGLLKGLSSLLVQTATYVGHLDECLAEAFCDECCAEDDDEEDCNHDVLVISPDGEQLFTDADYCLQQFPWFENVSVFEPVPGRDDLFITCDANSIAVAEGKKYLTGPAVIIRMEEDPDREGSVTYEDAIFVMKTLADRYGLLVSSSTGKNIKAICIS